MFISKIARRKVDITTVAVGTLIIWIIINGAINFCQGPLVYNTALVGQRRIVIFTDNLNF
jgi:hypothetical protein